MGKILFVANERFVSGTLSPLDLAELCAMDGHVVLVAAPFPPESLAGNRDRGFQGIPLADEGFLLGEARFCKRAVDVTAQHRPDVIIGVNAIGFVAADLARQAGFARRVVYDAIDLSIPKEKPLSLTARWQAQRARAAELVVTAGRDRADEMYRRFELRELPLVVAGAPIRAPTDVMDIRERVSRRGGRGEAIVCCLDEGGTQSHLLEAVEASRLWTANATLALHVSGGTTDWRRRLRRAVEESGGRTVLLPWPAGNRDDMLRSIGGADVGLVLPARKNDPSLHALWSLPERLFDFMACGIPVVTGEAPSLVSEVEQQGWGRSCESHKPEALAACVDSVFRQRAELAARADELFRTKCNLQAQSTALRARLAALADE